MISLPTENQLKRSIADLFIAGTETTATTIKWAILYFLHNPEVQNKMREELDDVVGMSRVPSVNDRCNLPYCQAVLTEVQRCGNISPFSIQHSCREDVSFQGFTIPKGALIIPNLDSVHSDSNIFADAEKFNPSRFINNNGKFFGQEKVIPFCIGKMLSEQF